jgi:hypothetical protein
MRAGKIKVSIDLHTASPEKQWKQNITKYV